jgi:hypothetical protein
MDNIPIEYSERMMAEQMVMMEALQLIFQILICFAILVTCLILIVNLSDFVRTRLSERRSSERRQPQSRAVRRRGSAIPFGENRV